MSIINAVRRWALAIAVLMLAGCSSSEPRYCDSLRAEIQATVLCASLLNCEITRLQLKELDENAREFSEYCIPTQPEPGPELL